MAKQDKRIDLRVTQAELELLDEYCQLTGKNRTDVLREFIRSLKKKMRNARSCSI
ncbi:ribbon-helix-helix protein, CopG family [Brasilonema sp. UFV-L1]|uniref:ribbon-helix-helix protein, CopG family n=1 Tax=Brasilonema sp. UFV-L1 TaxID=2234130 RepID=UPI00145D277A|nr:ribbon-helix-helix protein, CopG family [Brasilonema sp. UFV-L1]NMG07584.1 CopG family transcriptional regulator [Brasilonema sp. UFV-L1]